jgi:divalent metal cation (Fe/Co/Zn/Cd) transporter
VEDVDELRQRWFGHSLRAEVEIVVDPALSLVAAHRGRARSRASAVA